MAVKNMIEKLCSYIEDSKDIQKKAEGILMKFSGKGYSYLLSNILEVNQFHSRRDTLACLNSACSLDWGKKRRTTWSRDQKEAKIQEKIAELKSEFKGFLAQFPDSADKKKILNTIAQFIDHSRDAGYFTNYPDLHTLMRVNLPPHLRGLQIIYMKYFRQALSLKI